MPEKRDPFGYKGNAGWDEFKKSARADSGDASLSSEEGDHASVDTLEKDIPDKSIGKGA